MDVITLARYTLPQGSCATFVIIVDSNYLEVSIDAFEMASLLNQFNSRVHQ